MNNIDNDSNWRALKDIGIAGAILEKKKKASHWVVEDKKSPNTSVMLVTNLVEIRPSYLSNINMVP